MRFLVEGVLEAGLVWYGAGDAVDGGRRNKFFPVVVVVSTRLVVKRGRKGVRIEEVEGVSGREEVVELLVLGVCQQRLAIVVVVRDGAVEEVVREGVCAASQFG